MGGEMMKLVRWLGRNLSTLLLSFILAVIVWGSAVTSSNPNEERAYVIPIEVVGQETDIEILKDIPEQLLMTLYAPSSILNELNDESGELRAWVDLSGLERGVHTLPVQYLMPEQTGPLRLVDVSPKTVDVTLEQLTSITIPIQTEILGTPALGYQQGPTTWSDQEVVISGRLPDVQKVTAVGTSLDITGANEDIEQMVSLLPRDSDGNLVTGVTLNPNRIAVTQKITLRGGYRNMVVKVVTSGQVGEGYRQTNIAVSPPNVMVFSADPAMIEGLPGYIETQELDISGIVDDIETILALSLPEGVSVIGDPNVLIQVGVAAIEGSINISRRVEIIGILPGLAATVSPDTVEVIIFGPIPTLQTLTDVDVRVVVDLTSLEEGVYQLSPDVIILPDRLLLQVISPETLEIEITSAELGTPIPVPTPAP
jgi:YbbR domain-containing protein